MKRFIYAITGLIAMAGAIAFAQAPGVNSPWNPVWSIPIDSIKRTYGVSVLALSAAASATDIFQVCGGSGVTTRVTRVSVAGRATAVTSGDIILLKRSTASVGGTTYVLSATTGIPYDANISAGVSVATAWSANPTVGTAIGNLITSQINLSNLTTGVGSVPFVWAADRPASAVVLRGAASCLAVNLSSASYAGNLWNISAEWTEE